MVAWKRRLVASALSGRCLRVSVWAAQTERKRRSSVTEVDFEGASRPPGAVLVELGVGLAERVAACRGPRKELVRGPECRRRRRVKVGDVLSVEHDVDGRKVLGQLRSAACADDRDHDAGA